jgi:uncharacterized protein (DUF2336 family)
MQVSQQSVMTELEEAIQSGSPERRVETLRRVTDLFLHESEKLTDEQIDVFDDVLGHLIKRIEKKALVELSGRLAPVDNAPIDVIRSLAYNDEIAVAEPVLATSGRLTNNDLADIARTKSQGHLLAISGRPEIDSSVTDVLVMRGDSDVKRKVAGNSGARFSDNGFAALLKAAETDDVLAERTGMRLDFPIKLLRDLLARATEAVRNKLLAVAPPEIAEEIRRILEGAAAEIDAEASKPRNYDAAQKFVALLKQNNELNEKTLAGFAYGRKYEETVAGLALLSGTPIDIIKPLMRSRRNEGLLVPCRAANMQWAVTKAILECRFSIEIPEAELKQAEQEFKKLSVASAQRLLRFWQIRGPSARPL